jgi:hypothetical protein
MLTTADALPGGHRIGKFELREAVSSSGAGIVYRAWDRDLGFAVAIKEHLPAPTARRQADGGVVPVAPADAPAYARSLQNFIQITRALAHCDHPALVRVLQLEFAHGTAYRVMPWVDGEPLLDARRRLPRPPDAPALHQLLDDLLGALQAFHRTGNLHGSVRASQILLRPDGRALLLGPAQVLAAWAGVAEPGTDIQGLACVARLWIGATLAPSDQPRDEASARDQRYGRELMRVIDAAASPDAARRPQSVAEFRERLVQAQLADARVAAPPEAPRPKVSAAPGAAAASAAPGPREPLGPLGPLGPQIVSDPSWRLPPPPRRPRVLAGRRGPWWAAGAAVAVVLGLGWGLREDLWPTLLPITLWAPAPTPAPQPAPQVAPQVAASPEPAPAVLTPSAAASSPEPAPIPELAPSVEPQPSPALQAVPSEAPPPLAAAPPPLPMRPPLQAGPTGAPVPRWRSPRQVCGTRTQFALYLCMQQQCERPGWARHSQCERFRATDRVE